MQLPYVASDSFSGPAISPASPVVSSLRKRIDELEAAIETQKKLLKSLQEQQSATRCELNFHLDPMARLPLELQSDILLRCMPLSQPTPVPHIAPMLFLAVSRLWRDIALATPKLWTGLLMEPLPCRIGFSTLCELWVKCAQVLPLSLTLRGSLYLEPPVRNFLAECGPRLQCLVVEMGRNHVDSIKRQIRLNASFSRLECLEIQTEKDINLGDANDWVEPLRSAPNLVKYCLRNMFYEQSCVSDVRPLTHTSLQQLHLGRAWDEATPRGPKNSIDLHITFFDILDVTFISFLARSSPPLETLRITAPVLPDAIVSRCFQLMPSLVNLIIDGRHYRRFIKILGMGYAPPLLPALRHLTLVPDQLSPEDGGLVVKMLNVRRAHTDSRLQPFRLVYSLPDDADFVVGLQRLAREGLEIRVGEAGERL
ncbi:F-box domain-containing protein [Favolaschia claudopus]|uniref:F-box domain-containing protein n=1 Tax=Favolaschia claudopus TaxID=2862362 RepID=A0AAW0A2T2_9AGAR